MNIAEAVKKAQEINGYIANENFNGVFIKPTDTLDRCILCMTPDKQRRGWQPGAAELISDEWNVFTEEDFLSPSVNHNIF